MGVLRDVGGVVGLENEAQQVEDCCACCGGGAGCVGPGCFEQLAECADCITPFAESLGKAISCAASPCIWPIVYCFPADEDLGKQWDVSMEYAVCKAPCVCCFGLVCVQCTQIYIRYTVLDQDLSKYKCCQGIYDGPYCCAVCKPSLPFTFEAGTYGDAGNPLCLFLEACCCPFCAFEASREYQRNDRGLGYDPTETRVYKCLEFFGCIAECCVCCGCLTKCVGCCAGCCLGEQDFAESSDRLGNACTGIAYGIIKGMRWIIRIATACMSAQMAHEAKLPKTGGGAGGGVPGQMMGAPTQHQMGMASQGQKLKDNMGAATGPPVPAHVAKKFIKALREEYVGGREGAVGDCIDKLPGNQSSALEPYEEQVRASRDPSAAIQSLAQQWNI
eukprot:TRINITY_DN52645_c0_g1_i1.p1 TRINITY_DN52645_c0_g1~~TRINITY_DN52645_c0_g1_i1.p1  ORF type:complete len:411 (-),score=62.92 TRINITY_DN52645_c0_g1_i1:70-1236(-)